LKNNKVDINSKNSPVELNISKKNILVVFTDPHLCYSPSTLNLYDSLNDYFNVSIITFTPEENYSAQKLLNHKVEYLTYGNWLPEKGVPLITRLLNELKKTLFGIKINKEADPLLTGKANVLIERIKVFNGIIIAVDFFAMWCVQKAGKSAHLFSLEIIENDPYRTACDLRAIQSVAIQTLDRYEYLFGKREIKTYLIQNAPKFIKQEIDYSKRKNTNLIFCGSAMPEFGVFTCIEFLLDYPEYTLTVKGAIPPLVRSNILEKFDFLLKENRLILDETYLNPDCLNNFLSGYYIGFVFYDAFRFAKVNSFNYITAPSGKLFQYYNAGIPAIVSNIKGLNSVKELGTGIMINALNSSSIKNAITEIEANYLQFAMAAKKASIQFDFSRSVEPYISFLQEQ